MGFEQCFSQDNILEKVSNADIIYLNRHRDEFQKFLKLN